MTQGNITLTLSNLTPDKAAAILVAAGGDVLTAPARETKVAKPAETKTPKKKVTKVEEDEDIDDEDMDDEESDDVDTDEDDVEDDEDEPKAVVVTKSKKASAPTYEDVAKAFKEFSKKFDDVKRARTERAKVLKRFKVSEPSELEESDYAKVIKVLKA